MVQLIVFVPVSDKEQVKTALFEAGAGKVGLYECCCFESLGIGQFRGLDGSNPTIGKINELEKVEEARLEIPCEKGVIKSALNALKKVHPYETPVYYVIESVGLPPHK